MDLEDQVAIRRVADQNGHQDLLVLLGAPNAESAGIAAETVTAGDPTYAGALAGVSLRLPVYHIVEPEIKAEVDPEVYATQVGIMEMVLDSAQISVEMRRYRAG